MSCSNSTDVIKKTASRQFNNVGLAFVLLLLCFAKLDARAQEPDRDKSETANTALAEQNQPERARYEDAVKLIKQNKNLQAEAILKELAAKSDKPAVLTGYALVLLRLGKVNSSIDVLSKLRAQAPNSYAWLPYICDAYRASGQIDKAIVATEEYLNNFSKNEHNNQASPSRQSAHIAYVERELAKLRKNQKWQESNSSGSKEDYLQEASSPARWEKDSMPVKIFIEEGANAGLLKQAFAEWEAASGGKLQIEFCPSPEQAQIKCKWTSDVSLLASPLEGGETLVSKSTDGKIISADIQILLSEDPEEMNAAALHEAGHSLGLGHSSKPGDAMFFAFNSDAFSGKLSKRDQKTIKKIYNSTPEELAKLSSNERDEGADSNGPLQKAIDLNKQATSSFASEDFASAVQLLEKADSLAPNTQTIQENLARAYLKLADKDCQRQAFVDGEKHLNGAAIYFEKCKRIEDAKSVYRDLAALAKLLHKDDAEKSYLQKQQELNAQRSP